MQIFLVGGAVRDELLGYPVKERDWVVVGATPEDMLTQGYTQVGKDFPVFLHPQTHEEYALARTERKSGTGYTGFTVHAAPDVTLEEDLRRRDLTVNAIARDEQGQLIDPFNGKTDLDAKILRHVSEAFVEDPLRVLRVARFAARFAHLGFKVAPETMALMSEIAASGELSTLVPERVWTETAKALSERTPSQYFRTLRGCGALVAVFPELDALFGVPQRADYHPEIDTGIHTMMVVDEAARLSEDTGVRFAALVHDLGKAQTPAEILPSHVGHEKTSARLVRGLCERIRVPNNIRDLGVLVAQYHSHVHRAFELRPGTLLELFEGIDLFRRKERLPLFLLACKADSRGRTGFEDNPYPQLEFLTAMANVCLQVSAQSYVEQGLQGKEIAAALRRQRLQNVAIARREWFTQHGIETSGEDTNQTSEQ